MFFKKNLMMVIAIVLTLGMVVGCSNNDNNKQTTDGDKKETVDNKDDNKKDNGKKDEIQTLDIAIVADPDNMISTIAEQFMKDNPNIKVEVNAIGQDYENVLKIKMASNQLPDIFETHGWAQVRYGKYLADLRDESWVGRLSESIKPAVIDNDGKVYALPVDQEKTGMVYNAGLLEEYGVDVPTTYAELLEACETIKTKSGGKVTPIHLAGKDSWPVGFFFDFFATPSFISMEDNYGEQLKDGSFEWNNFTPLPAKFLELYKKGYLNEDVLTAGYSDSAMAFGNNEVAFAVYGPYLIQEAKKTNPDIKGGIMPVPAIAEGDTHTFVGGERFSIGVWKDSKSVDAAKLFLEYCARPENAKRICEFNAVPSGLNDVDVDLGDLTSYYDSYKDVRIFPYFDRVYLPNGMWDTMCKNGQDLLAGAITPEQFSENMEKEYIRLRNVK
jgi:raffinose/stachyose/melibiose transport system substrate-binding protein